MFDSCTYIGGGRIHFHTAQFMKKRVILYHRILHMASGCGEFVFDKIRFSIKPGNLYILAPGTRSARYFGDSPVAYEYIEFHAPSILIDTPCQACRIEEPFRSVLAALIHCTAQVSGNLRRQLLAATLGLALNETSATRTSDIRLRRVLSHIEEHPDRSATIGALAEIAGISEPQLRRLFRAELGVSPKRYLMRARMDYAQRLLRAEGLRVNEVATLMGFPSAFQFSAQYRKIHHAAPSQYRSINKSDSSPLRTCSSRGGHCQ